MDPKDFMLSEIIHSQKVIYCIIPFIRYFRKDKTILIENRAAVS
jgi:hypothetical protein